MAAPAAPCTTLSVMTTMSDLTDDFRLHAFAAGLSLLHHRFDRAQVFVDFANKSADAPATTLSIDRKGTRVSKTCYRREARREEAAVGAGARGEQHEERHVGVDLERARQRTHVADSVQGGLGDRNNCQRSAHR